MADLTFTIEFTSNGEPVLKNIARQAEAAGSGVERAVARTAPAFQKAADASNQLTLSGTGAQRVMVLLAHSLGATGPVGNLAANALLQVAAGGGAIGIALAGTSAGLGFLISHFRQASEEAKKFKEATATGDLNFFTDQVRGLNLQLRELEDKFAISRRSRLIEPGSAQAQIEDIIHLRERAEIQDKIGKVTIERENILSKSFQQAALSIEFQTAAIGATADEIAELTKENTIAIAMQRGLADASRETKDAFIEIAEAQRASTVAENLRKTTIEINNQVAASRSHVMSLMAVGEQSIHVATAQKLQALSASEVARAYPELARGLAAVIKQTDAFETAIKRVNTGQQGLANFTQQFGGQFDVVARQQQQALAGQFAVVFRRFKDDPAMQQMLGESFSSLIDQLSARGTKNISGLLTSVGINVNEALAKTRDLFIQVNQEADVFQQNAFGGTERVGTEIRTNSVSAFTELDKKIKDSGNSIADWGRGWPMAEAEFLKAAADVGAGIDELVQKTQALKNEVVQSVAITIDVDGAVTEVNRLKQLVESFPDVTRKQVVVDVFYAMSPQRPFSEFLPAMREKFGDLNRIVRELTPEIAFNVRDLPSRLTEIRALEARVADVSFLAARGLSSEELGRGLRNRGVEASNRFFAGHELRTLEPQLGNLRFNLAADIFQASQRSGGGGGGGGPTIVIDMRDALITADVIQDSLLPELRNLIRQTTGKDPGFRVLS